MSQSANGLSASGRIEEGRERDAFFDLPFHSRFNSPSDVNRAEGSPIPLVENQFDVRGQLVCVRCSAYQDPVSRTASP